MAYCNNQWYYGNQSNTPTLVSTSKEINEIYSTASITINGNVTNNSYYILNFTSIPDYYTYDIMWFKFSNWTSSRVSSSTGETYLGLNTARDVLELYVVDTEQQYNYKTQNVVIVSNHITASNYNSIVFVDAHTNTATDAAEPLFVAHNTSNRYYLENMLSGTLTLNNVQCTLYATKFEY